MRGKLTRTALTVIGLAGVSTAAMSTERAAAAVAVALASALILAGIALIQVGAHDPFDHGS